MMEQEAIRNTKTNKLNASISDIQQQDMIEKALIKAGLPQNKLNGMLEELKEKMMCGPSCQKQQKIDALKKIYNDKKREVKMAPEELRLAEKNYYEFSKGRQFYNNMMEKRASEYTTKTIEEMGETRLEKTKEINDLLSYYESAYIYYSKLDDIAEDNVDKNSSLHQQYDNDLSTTETNERIAHYEIDNIRMMDKWIFLVKAIYWIIFVSYVIIILVNGGYSFSRSNIMHYGILLIGIISPFILQMI